MNFHVMQPGSSVATSLMPGEAVPKHVAILSITGKEFKSEPIQLKTVRPFVMKEIVLAEERALKNVWRSDNNRVQITRHLIDIVDDLIKEAEKDWLEIQDGAERLDEEEQQEPPKPLIRLRVEYTAPEGGRFDCENPQRFSNRFVGRVANVNDVVQFYRKKASATRSSKNDPEMPEESIMAQLAIDSVKVEKLVREFLTAQSLTILPQNSFGDAVSQFVDKDDKHAMEMFVNESLSNQMKHLLQTDEVDEEDIVQAMDQYRSKLELMFASGQIRKNRKAKLKPKPDNWDSDLDGEWADQPGALIHSEGEAEQDEDGEELGSIPPKPPAARGRGKAAATTRKAAAAPKKAPARGGARAKKKAVEDDEDEDEDVVMIDDDDEEEEEDDLFVKPTRATAKKPAAKAAPKRAASPVKKTPARAAAKKQSTLSFSQPATQGSQVNGSSRKVQEPVRLI